jgi:hypothetical protein
MELGSDSGSRKFNLISPVIKTHKSRGARFLDLVKQNKINVSPQLSKRLSVNKNLINDLMKKDGESRDEGYLKFKSTIPDPLSSPSSSILSKSKRKAIEQDRMETPDSPANNSAKVKDRPTLAFHTHNSPA